MDAVAAMERMADLEDRLRQVTQERNNYASAIVNYEAFIKRIPRVLPPELAAFHQEIQSEFTPNAWLDWAIQELGYEKSD